MRTEKKQAELAQKARHKSETTFSDYAFKSYISLITSGTKKVNTKLFAECAISRVILLP